MMTMLTTTMMITAVLLRMHENSHHYLGLGARVGSWCASQGIFTPWSCAVCIMLILNLVYSGPVADCMPPKSSLQPWFGQAWWENFRFCLSPPIFGCIRCARPALGITDAVKAMAEHDDHGQAPSFPYILKDHAVTK